MVGLAEIENAGVAELVALRPLPVADKGSNALSEITSKRKYIYVRRIATIFQTGRRAYHFAKPLIIFQFNICTCGGTGRRARFRF